MQAASQQAYPIVLSDSLRSGVKRKRGDGSGLYGFKFSNVPASLASSSSMHNGILHTEHTDGSWQLEYPPRPAQSSSPHVFTSAKTNTHDVVLLWDESSQSYRLEMLAGNFDCKYEKGKALSDGAVLWAEQHDGAQDQQKERPMEQPKRQRKEEPVQQSKEPSPNQANEQPEEQPVEQVKELRKEQHQEQPAEQAKELPPKERLEQSKEQPHKAHDSETPDTPGTPAASQPQAQPTPPPAQPASTAPAQPRQPPAPLSLDAQSTASAAAMTTSKSADEPLPSTPGVKPPPPPSARRTGSSWKPAATSIMASSHDVGGTDVITSRTSVWDDDDSDEDSDEDDDDEEEDEDEDLDEFARQLENELNAGDD